MARRGLLVLLFLALGAATSFAQANPDWHREFPAFKIAGNLYYVGTADLAVYLVATPQGNILINTDFKEDLPQIKKSIAQAGFAYKDTKIVLISHAHGDHDEGTAVVRDETGAKLMVMDADVPDESSRGPGRPGATVDRALHDGDTVDLGGTTLVAHLTPGHTKGCTTWTMKVTENGKTLDVVIVGSLNVNQGFILVNNLNYPRIADDYMKTFDTMKKLPCDIFLGAHGAYFDLKTKYPKLQAGGGANPFIDPEGYKAYVAERNEAFKKELARQRQGAGAAP